MISNSLHRVVRPKTSAGLLLLSFFVSFSPGCATPARMDVRAERYQLELRLDPPSHEITGRTALDVFRVGPPPTPGPASIEIRLHPDLRITSVRAAGVQLSTPALQRLDGASDTSDGFQPARYAVNLRRPADALTLFIEYEGRLHQDVAAGEKPGEIHNFSMRAHIAPEGIYLADGYWYPQPATRDDAPPLSDFTLRAHAPPGVELIASGERDPSLSEHLGGFAWRSPYPLPQMSLVGGPLRVFRERHGDRDIAVYLSKDHAADAALWLTAIKRNLDRYEPLIGPLPTRDYAVVENFFSSGFAFPCFTLLSSAVIGMGQRSATTHGYLDHEMLHSWWGNGVLVDPRDGNWCEALTSYCTNYYGHVLDGNLEEARRKRRNYSHFFSRLKPEDDKPLGTFDRPGGCNRSIAYDKGAMVFHMLARKIGQDAFWSALRDLSSDCLGGYASWNDLRTLFEGQSHVDLGPFFKQWVRGPGAPSIAIESASFRGAESTLSATLKQKTPVFQLDDLPLQARTFRSGPDSRDDPAGAFTVSITSETQVVTFRPPFAPDEIVLDPDYHLLRKVTMDEIVPTTAATRRGGAFAVVIPSGAVSDEYLKLKKSFESSFDAAKRIERVAGQIEPAALAERSTLILGDAVRDPYVEAFLTALEFPVTWTDDAFEFDEEEYNDPGDAVLCTVRHPGVSGGGVTVVFANSESAIPKASLVPMYEHSLVIFRDGKPVLRQDFENPQVVQAGHETK